MNILVIIPARGGSKGIPGKNIKLLGGKPLIYYAQLWTIRIYVYLPMMIKSFGL